MEALFRPIIRRCDWGEEREDFETPGVEFLYDSLEQITEYATVHLKVKSEFKRKILESLLN